MSLRSYNLQGPEKPHTSRLTATIIAEASARGYKRTDTLNPQSPHPGSSPSPRSTAPILQSTQRQEVSVTGSQTS